MQKHILIVDDEDGIRDVLSQLFDCQGYRVSTAHSGAEALKICNQSAPHLVISDLQMEDADGLELIEQIKEIIPSVPVILLTGMIFDHEVVRENIHKKVSCYLEKSTPLESLMREVERLLKEAEKTVA